MLVEVIVTNAEEAVLAQKYGANRLELIHAFELGGLSPALEISKAVCAAVKIPVNVMLRPHGSNFTYTQKDIDQITIELDYLKNNTKAHAIVFGALTPDGVIDTELLQYVISHKRQLKLVFHRAIDNTKDILKSYEQLINYQEVDNILTSGGMKTALQGRNIIRKMVELSKTFSFCQIIAGSGITAGNAVEIIHTTGVKQIHIGSGVRTNGRLDKNKFDKLLNSIKS